MINLLKFIAHHFRLWFLPQPAHDDIKPSKDEIKSVPSTPEPEPTPAPAPALEPATADAPPPQKLVLSDSPDDRPDFSHLVKEPEAADQRLSRSAYSSQTKSDEPDTEPESKPEPTPPAEDTKNDDQD